MRMTITIQRKKEEIIRIEIDNHNQWRYWDDHIDLSGHTDSQILLTLNNINETYYLSLPVKDELPTDIDKELYEKTKEIKYNDKIVRIYNSLLEYLNCRIENVKEYEWSESQTFKCVLFEEYKSSRILSENITYDCESFDNTLNEINVKIEKI